MYTTLAFLQHTGLYFPVIAPSYNSLSLSKYSSGKFCRAMGFISSGPAAAPSVSSFPYGLLAIVLPAGFETAPEFKKEQKYSWIHL